MAGQVPEDGRFDLGTCQARLPAVEPWHLPPSLTVVAVPPHLTALAELIQLAALLHARPGRSRVI